MIWLYYAGDVGCSAGPMLAGMVANANGDNIKIGIMPAIIFPILILIGIPMLRGKKNEE